jgi:hypothetical protein
MGLSVARKVAAWVTGAVGVRPRALEWVEALAKITGTLAAQQACSCWLTAEVTSLQLPRSSSSWPARCRPALPTRTQPSPPRQKVPAIGALTSIQGSSRNSRRCQCRRSHRRCVFQHNMRSCGFYQPRSHITMCVSKPRLMGDQFALPAKSGRTPFVTGRRQTSFQQLRDIVWRDWRWPP